MPAKYIRIKGQPFVKGRAECGCCEHKFKYLLAAELFLLWDGNCSVCSIITPVNEPEPGQIVLEVIQPDF